MLYLPRRIWSLYTVGTWSAFCLPTGHCYRGLYRIEIPASDFKLLFERSRWMWKRHRRQFMDNSKRELTSTDGKDYREFLEEHLPKGESPWQFWNTDSFAYLDISRKCARYFRKIFKDKNWSQEKEGWKQALGRLPGVRHSETKMSSMNLDVWQCEWLFSPFTKPFSLSGTTVRRRCTFSRVLKNFRITGLWKRVFGELVQQRCIFLRLSLSAEGSLQADKDSLPEPSQSSKSSYRSFEDDPRYISDRTYISAASSASSHHVSGVPFFNAQSMAV